MSLLPTVIALGAAAILALALALSRPLSVAGAAARAAAARALAITVGIQAVHFAEEAVTGFPQRLGASFNLPAMPFSFFIAFNVVWLGIWIASVPGIRSGRVAAAFAAWFLAIAGMINGIAHPLLAAAAESYFPGLVTSSLVGVAAVWLALRLWQASSP